MPGAAIPTGDRRPGIYACRSGECTPNINVVSNGGQGVHSGDINSTSNSTPRTAIPALDVRVKCSTGIQSAIRSNGQCVDCTLNTCPKLFPAVTIPIQDVVRLRIVLTSDHQLPIIERQCSGILKPVP